jgi:predicted transcriptional regulator with HTH domain
MWWCGGLRCLGGELARNGTKSECANVKSFLEGIETRYESMKAIETENLVCPNSNNLDCNCTTVRDARGTDG